MELLVDTHTHTVASGHAYSTLRENAIVSKQNGMQAICCTDHGPRLKGGAVDFIIPVLAGVPREIEGLRVFCGTEANILDFSGKVDIPERFLKVTEFAIASMHDIVIDPGTEEENTEAMIAALRNPYIDVLGHPGNPYYPVNREALVKEAARLGKLVEINNHSFEYRTGSAPNCKNYLSLCKQYGVRIVVSSDAHICYNIGKFEYARAAIEETDFPEELIASRNLVAFEEYLQERKERLRIQ
ncbi:MAG: phosphatase [Christensenella sp.]|nr:phosphatase [Christensenella sp.]